MELTDYEYRKLLGLIGIERREWQRRLRKKLEDRDRVDYEISSLDTLKAKLTTNQAEWVGREEE